MKLVRLFFAFMVLTTVLMAFTACESIASPLEDFRWLLIQYGAPGGIHTPLPQTEVIAFFESKTKTVSGGDGFNDYTGTYNVDRLTVSINGTLLVTKNACSMDIAAQESYFISTLQRADRFEMDHGKLTIFAGIDMLTFKNTDSTVKPPTHWGG
jgi:heat shock protein HslJ